MKVYYQILKYHYYMDDVIEGSNKLFNKHNKLNNNTLINGGIHNERNK